MFKKITSFGNINLSDVPKIKPTTKGRRGLLKILRHLMECHAEIDRLNELVPEEHKYVEVGQLTLMPPPPKLPRAKPRKLMHFIDVGGGDCEEGANLALFECKRCGHKSDWLVCSTTEVKRGVPCPECNK